MNAHDFAIIESALQVALPSVFKDFMRQFPGDAAHQLKNDHYGDVLPTNAELFVIAQLQLKQLYNDHGADYYELQPDLRDHRFIQIGGDGCGNFFFMAGNDTDSKQLWFWEHDPYNGFVQHEDSLVQYLGPSWKLTSQPDPFANTPSDGTIVSRADHPARSILTPILMEEWQHYIAGDSRLQLDENHTATNPFTGETESFRRWPGRARLAVNDSSAHIAYSHGCLTLSSDPDVAPAHNALMQSIAQELGADLF